MIGKGHGVAKVRTTKRSTEDGLMELEDHVPVGREYLIDLATVQAATFFNVVHGVRHRKVVVGTVDERGRPTGFMAVELLELAEPETVCVS